MKQPFQDPGGFVVFPASFPSARSQGHRQVPRPRRHRRLGRQCGHTPCGLEGSTLRGGLQPGRHRAPLGGLRDGQDRRRAARCSRRAQRPTSTPAPSAATAPRTRRPRPPRFSSPYGWLPTPSAQSGCGPPVARAGCPGRPGHVLDRVAGVLKLPGQLFFASPDPRQQPGTQFRHASEDSSAPLAGSPPPSAPLREVGPLGT